MGVTTTGGIVLRVSALIRLRTIGRHWWHADKASSNPTFLCILHKGEDKWSKNKDKMQNDMINKRAYRQAKGKIYMRQSRKITPRTHLHRDLL